MTREERIEKLRHLITCMKCEVSGKCCDDNCSTQYDAGNMGEIIENLEEIAKALEQEPCEDAISRQAVLDGVDRYIYKSQSTGTQDDFYSFAELVVKQLPSVTPQPKTGHCKECKWWKDSDGVYRRGIEAESLCPINTNVVYFGDGYCYMYEPQEKE